MKTSPALKALLLVQAEAFVADLHEQSEKLDPLEFYRWVADRQYRDACDLAHLARTELEKSHR